MEIGEEKLDGEAGESGSAAEVQQGFCWGEMGGGEEAFAEVAADDLFGVADGGEVGAGVPLEEQVEVEGELGENCRWEGPGIGRVGLRFRILREQACDCQYLRRGCPDRYIRIPGIQG